MKISISSFWRLIWSHNLYIIGGAILFGLWTGGYFLVGHLTLNEPAARLTTALDRSIPFQPKFVWFYMTLYPVFLIPFLSVRDRQFFKLMAYAYTTVMVLCYTIFFVFPVIMDRPALEVVDFSTWALKKFYNNDPPVNCFPSMHVAMAMLASLTLYEISRRQGIFCLALTLVIGASTVLTKQHYVADVLVAIVIAVLAYYAYFRQRITALLSARLGSIDARVDAQIEEHLEPLVKKIVSEEVARLLFDEIKKRNGSPPTMGKNGK